MLGFSLLKDSFQFVEIDHKDGKPVVQRFAKRSVPIPLSHDNLLNEDFHNRYKQVILEAVEEYNLAGPVVISLDSQLAFVKKFLVDLSLEEEKIEEQLNWEYRQIFPQSSLSEYNFVYAHLSAGLDGNKAEVLAVAFRKDLAKAVKMLFGQTDLDLKQIDLDLFSALNGLNELYGTAEIGLSALADVRRDTLKIQFIRKGEFFDCHKISIASEGEESNGEAFDSDESLSRLLNKEMRRKLLEYRLDSEDKAIDALYLFGEKANSDLVDYLAISPAREVVLVEPFKKLEINSELAGYSEDTPLSSEYTISIGSALRAIE